MRVSLVCSIIVATAFSSLSIAQTPSQNENPRQSGKKIGKGSTLSKITLSAPKGGWTVDRMVEVAGEVSDSTVDPLTVTINGDRYLLRTFNGKFKRKFPITAGKNAIVVSATNKGGTATEGRTVFAKISPVALMAILTSDTDGVYTDLHIYEPDPTATAKDDKPNQHIYWASTRSKSGGQFYLNEQGGDFDQPGFGPYLYTHSAPPIGIYRIDANYWPSGDKAHTLGTLNLVLFGGTPSELRRNVQQPLVAPGETVTLAWVKIEKGETGSIYVPGVDTKPKDTKIWPQWVIDAPPRRKGTDGGEGE